MRIYNNTFEADGVKVGVKWLRPRMLEFFKSVLYQIENEECADIVGISFLCVCRNLQKTRVRILMDGGVKLKSNFKYYDEYENKDKPCR